MSIDQDGFIVAISLVNNAFGIACFKPSSAECFVSCRSRQGINNDLMQGLLDSQHSCRFFSSTKSDLPAIQSALPECARFSLQPAADFDPFLLHSEDLNCLVDLADVNEMSCMALAAIVQYLKSNHLAQHLPITVLEYKEDSENHLVIDKHSLYALEVFDNDPHPNLHMEHGAKDSFSIFHLINNTASALGEAKLRTWLHKPLNAHKAITERLDSIEAALSLDGFEVVVRELQSALKTITRCERQITELKFRPSASNLLAIARICNNVASIRDIIMTTNLAAAPLFKDFANHNLDSLPLVGRKIHSVLDNDASKYSDLFVVRKYVNPDLDRLRENYQHLPAFLAEVVEGLVDGSDNPTLSAINITYFPQLGFLLTLPVDEETAETVAAENGLDLQFLSDSTAYFKSEKMRGTIRKLYQSIDNLLELDSTIGDIYADIIDAQVEIMQELCELVFGIETQLNLAVEACSSIDCIISLAKAASTLELTRPDIVDERVVEIDHGRHLLVELNCSTFITNDCKMGRPIVLTGANASGKSVFLKQVGIIALLAHVGRYHTELSIIITTFSFVPARCAKIGIMDRILTRIRVDESVRMQDSTFSSELKQVKLITDTCSSRSLILIDEFGKGTCEQDGLALFSALIGHLGEKCPCPMFIASTHLHEIFKMNLVDKPSLYQYLRMQVIKDKHGLCMLYRIEEGLAQKSFAIECAKESGLDQEIVTRAYTLLQGLEAGLSPEELQYQSVTDATALAALKYIRNQ